MIVGDTVKRVDIRGWGTYFAEIGVVSALGEDGIVWVRVDKRPGQNGQIPYALSRHDPADLVVVVTPR